MEENDLKASMEESATRLFARQPNIFGFTSATGQTEWNLAHHLAIELHGLFPDYDCDIDVMKRNFKNRRPDIILHSRGTHENNFLVVEVKWDGRPGELRHDLAKVATYWLQPPLRYRFGAVIDLRSDKTFSV